MSILDGLRKSADLVPIGAGWYNAALDDVAEALRNPTDEQLALIYRAVWDAGGYVPHEHIRVVLAATAGGDQ